MMGWGRRITVNSYEVSFGDDENVLELDGSDGCTTCEPTRK